MEWRASLLVKYLKVNARKTKLVVSRSGGGVVFELSAWLGEDRGVCSKGVAANRLQCSVCVKYIHMMRSLRLKGQVYMACIRSCLFYGCETWAMTVTAELESKMERTEIRVIRWMCDVSLKERHPSIDLRRCLGVEAIGM